MTTTAFLCLLLAAARAEVEASSAGDLGVEHQHQGSTDCAESIGTSSLEHGGDTLVLDDLAEAVHGAGVHPFGLGLLRLHLQTTADSVEGVRSISSGDGGELGAAESGEATEQAVVRLLVWVVVHQGVEEAEVHTTVWDDAND